MDINSQRINCGNIRFTNEAISELDHGTVVVSIPRKNIIAMNISFGLSTEKRFRRIIVSLSLMAIGLVIGIFPLYHLMFTYGADGTSGPGLKLIAFAVPLVLIGLWLLIEIFRRSHYLLIKTDSGMRRIPLEDCIPSEVIIAASNMGYPVDSKPLE